MEIGRRVAPQKSIRERTAERRDPDRPAHRMPPLIDLPQLFRKLTKPKRPLRIVYLIEDTEIAGGIRVAAAHADVLTDRGHEVTLATKGQPMTWRSTRAKWAFVRDWSELDASAFDFVVGTFWTTVEPSYRLAGERAVHFCQGYEGSFTAYQSIKPRIDAAYALPIPKITVSPRLVPICQEFTQDVTYVGQIVDDEFYQQNRAARTGLPRVLLFGPAQSDVKGIDAGYEAVRIARAQGAQFDLIRVTPWPAAADEPLSLASEVHVGIATGAVASLFASAHAFLGPNRKEEGFGLPAAEAMAGGVPTILTEIPSYLSWSERRDHALFVPEGDASAMAAGLMRLLKEDRLRVDLARRARGVVEQFRGVRVGAALENWFAGRLSGSTRTHTSGR